MGVLVWCSIERREKTGKMSSAGEKSKPAKSIRAALTSNVGEFVFPVENEFVVVTSAWCIAA
jgi:hypothetical protein